MKAMVLDHYGGPEALALGDVPVPVPEPDQFLVAVKACGVCGHDLLARAGALGTPLPMVLGHEISGVVVEVGRMVRQFSVGDRVALVQRIPCGKCRLCLRGSTNLCRLGPGFYGEQQSGGYAPYVLASELNAAHLPNDIPWEVGAILSCAVGTGLRALRRARLEPGALVVITGAGGGVGLNAVMVGVALGLRVVAVSGSPSKYDDLRDAGAEAILAPMPPKELRVAIKELSGGWGADAVIDIAGPPTFAASVSALAPGGRLILVGNTAPSPVDVNPGLIILQELEILGSAHATRNELEELITMISKHRIAPAIGAVRPLEEIPQLHRAMDICQVAGRAVVQMGSR